MMFNAMLWNLSTHEWWIIGIGALVCASCSLQLGEAVDPKAMLPEVYKS